MGNYCYGENLIDTYGSNRNKINNMDEQLYFSSQKFSKNSDFLKSRKFVIFGDNASRNFMYQFDYQRKKFAPISLPDKHKFYNYSGVVQKDEDTIIVCGGIQHNLTNIQKQCFEIQLSTLNIKKLPPMIEFRYTFPIVFLNNCIYAIGGRQYGDDHVSILKRCEKYDYRTQKWTSIAEMNIQRCTHTAFVYREQIWTIGGYTGRFQRSKKVEVYLHQIDRWEIVDFKLQQGFENGVVTNTNNPNEILILGGKKNYGQNQACCIYNLQTKTVINRKPLKYSNIIPKYSIYDNKHAVILSESTSGTNQQNSQGVVMEVYNIHNFQNYGIKLTDFPLQIKKMKQNNCNIPQLEIKYSPEINQQFLDVDYTQINIIFGTDQEPFQVEIDQTTALIKVLPIPVKLYLQNFQGLCRISNNEVFFAGGINSAFRKITQRAFIYNLQTREIQKVDSMNNFRYTFPLIKFKNYVYAIGGREFGDNSSAIMNKVERYNLVTGHWEYTGPLNIQRCTSNVFVYGNNLFVAGGFTPNTHTDTIEIFQEKTQQWFLLGMNLYVPLEASIFVVKDDNVYCFGGRSNKGGDQNDICKVLLKDKDFGQTIKIGSFRKRMCLHKLIYVRESFVIFGNKSMQFNMIDTQTFKRIKKFKHDYLPLNGSSNSSIRNCGQYEYFCRQLTLEMQKICFDKDGPKKCSHVDSFTNINQFKQKIFNFFIFPIYFLNLNHLMYHYFAIKLSKLLIFSIIVLPNKILLQKIKIIQLLHKKYSNSILFMVNNLCLSFDYLHKHHKRIFFHCFFVKFPKFNLQQVDLQFHIVLLLKLFMLFFCRYEKVFLFNLLSI